MIELRDVSYQYESGTQSGGLRNINLSIKKGEVVLLCGSSGCGKTTLTRLMNGLIPNYYEGKLSGEVLIKGKDVFKTPLYEIATYVGSVFQNPRSQFFCVDTNSELAFGCENQGLPIKEIESRIDQTVSQLNIENLMQRSIFKLSGGEKQKIACGCVHTASPDIIVLDEPSSNLDVKVTNNLANIIARWKAEGKTLVIAEHRLYYLRELADRMIYMRDGEIVRDYTMTQAKKLSSDQMEHMGLRPLWLESLTPQRINESTVQEQIELRGFQYAYKNEPKTLNMDALSLPKGQIIAVIGDNGAGKSTFARCLCGLNKTFDGTLLMGQRTYRKRQCMKQSYMVMQDVNHQLFTESVIDEVLLSMKEENTQRAEEILDSLNLLPLKEQHPMSLSGGQKQRVAIASAIASERDIIVFDEPTSGLDFMHMEQVASNLKQLKVMGKTIVIISHDLELIMKTCDHIIHIESGKVKESCHINSAGYKVIMNFFKLKRAFTNT